MLRFNAHCTCISHAIYITYQMMDRIDRNQLIVFHIFFFVLSYFFLLLLLITTFHAVFILLSLQNFSGRWKNNKNKGNRNHYSRQFFFLCCKSVCWIIRYMNCGVHKDHIYCAWTFCLSTYLYDFKNIKTKKRE